MILLLLLFTPRALTKLSVADGQLFHLALVTLDRSVLAYKYASLYIEARNEIQLLMGRERIICLLAGLYLMRSILRYYICFLYVIYDIFRRHFGRTRVSRQNYAV